ncbi:hypothetical protein ANO11243_020160 [Dothideomycetidae sp. 11243]|nr:hypothetical protein ANO11243_020160 [fungal sp. No.11243]
MKRWATLADGTLAFRAQPEMQREEQIRLGALLDSKGTVLREECKAWIEGNWLELKTRERSRAKEAKALRGGNGDNSERVRELNLSPHNQDQRDCKINTD